MHTRFSGCRSLYAFVYGGITFAVLVASACSKTSKEPSPGPAVASGSASPAPVLEAPPVPSWNAAYSTLLGEQPEPVGLQLEPPRICPSCATQHACQHLTSTFQSRYDEIKAELRKTGPSRLETLAATYGPFMLGYGYRQGLLDHGGLRGAFLGPKAPSKTLLVPMPAGTEGLWESVTTEDAGLSSKLREVGGSAFRCRVRDSVEISWSDAAPIPGAKPGGAADLLICDAVAIVVPRSAAVAKVEVKGDVAGVVGYDDLPDLASPDARTALAAHELVGARIEIRGAARLRRWPTPDYRTALFSAWHASPGLAASTTWELSFGSACLHGAACDEHDGLEAPQILLIEAAAPPKPRSPSPSNPELGTPAATGGIVRPSPDSRGRWEDAARAVDPMARTPGAAAQPWRNGFFTADPKDSVNVGEAPSVGAKVSLTTRSSDSDPKILGWREKLAESGGVQGFRCRVRDVALTRQYASLAVSAAGNSLHFDTSGGTVLAILCDGSGETSMDGVVVLLPTHAARAVIENGVVGSYEAPEGAFYDELLGKQLLNTPVGVALEVAAPPHVSRYPAGEPAFGARDYAMWVADFRSFRCAHQGLGCAIFDGMPLPVVKANPDAKPCAVANTVYPPAGYTMTPPAPQGSPLPAPPPAEERKRATDGATMVKIPAGVFVRGTQGGNVDSPPRLIWLDEYWMDKTEVTTSQYAGCITAGACTGGMSANTETQKYCHRPTEAQEGLPVNCIGRFQAEAYCKWAGAALPTEAQWEKAARGEAGRPFPWGDASPSCTLASMFGGCGKLAALPVGSRPAGRSPFGVLGMSGGVWEWVLDPYTPYYATSSDRNPAVADAKANGVIRGGCWGDDSWTNLTTYRRWPLHPAMGTEGTGFRCAQRL